MTSIRRAVILALAAALALAVSSPALAALGDRTLRQGMRGDDVKSLQTVVTRLGFPTTADGAFGAKTADNVKRWEARRRLYGDGVVNCLQAHWMAREAAARATGSPRALRLGDRKLLRGMRGNDVKALQSVLTRIGLRTAPDGAFGAGTDANVRRWELGRGLHRDGIVNCVQAHTMRRHAEGLGGYTHVFPVRGPHGYGGAGSRFGASRGDHRHQGHDIPAASGTPLVAVTRGKVAWRRYQASGAGHYLVIHGDDGTDYVYMHLSRTALVAPGRRVVAGQRIGYVGCTGSCTGPHLHFELWTRHWYDGGRPFDPLPRLRRWDAYS